MKRAFPSFPDNRQYTNPALHTLSTAAGPGEYSKGRFQHFLFSKQRDFKHPLPSQLEEFCCKPDPEEPRVPPLLLAGIQAPTAAWKRVLGILPGAEFQGESACTGAVSLSVGEEPAGQPGAGMALGSRIPLGPNLWEFDLCHLWVCAVRDPVPGAVGMWILQCSHPSAKPIPALCFLLEDFPAESP